MEENTHKFTNGANKWGQSLIIGTSPFRQTVALPGLQAIALKGRGYGFPKLSSLLLLIMQLLLI